MTKHKQLLLLYTLPHNTPECIWDKFNPQLPL